MKKQDKFFFGDTEVSKSQKVDKVQNVFNSVSKKYDIMNDILSLGTHRIWKEALVSMIGNLRSSSMDYRYLDLACGTGDIAYKLLKKYPQLVNVYMIDINHEMIKQAKKRDEYAKYKEQITFIVSDAENIPLPSKSVDCITIAFGIRNVASIKSALKEINRVLKYGGKFLCLEFSKIEVPLIDKFYDFYSDNVIPKIGDFIVKDKTSYQYLVESIRKFPTQENFLDQINQSGFSNIKYKNLSGGIATIHSAWKV
tara:strand:+ start:48169 stop:48930 length:762 start_codon:yes stop_codon:yes gene_type:complete